MKKQQGAALIVVMSLLSVSLTLGLMNMQTSQVDERLAGNYKAAAEAQMAAEFGAAYGIEMMLGTPDYFEEHDSGEACEDFAEPGLSEQGRRGLDGDVEWYEVDGIDAEIIGCQYDSGPLYLSWGQVRDGGGLIVSESFVIFSGGGGDGDGGGGEDDSWPPDLSEVFTDDDGVSIIGSDDVNALNENALLVGGALVRNGGGDVLGPEPRFNLPDWTTAVPDPQQVVEWVSEKSDQGDSLIVNSCDANFPSGGASIVFCDGDFVGDLDDSLSGMIVVATGNIGNWTPGNQRINVQGDVDTYLISGGSMNFSGFGNNTISGGVWAGGSLHVNGSSNFCGSVVVRGAANFNGQSNFDIESEGCVPGGGNGDNGGSGGGDGGPPPVWIPL